MLTNTSGCSTPQVMADFNAALCVQLLFGLTICVCVLAIVTMKRCKKVIKPVVFITVCHALLLHVLVAIISIVCLTLALTTEPSGDLHKLTDTFYLWLGAFCWQEHMVYLLFAIINCFPSVMYDHAIMYTVATYGTSTWPILGETLPHFTEFHQLECDHNIWRPKDDLITLAFMIPTLNIQVLMIALVVLEMTIWNKKSRQIYTTCSKCLECANDRIKRKHTQLLRLLVVLFVLTSLPRLVFWSVTYQSSSSVYRENRWLVLSVNGIRGTLQGLAVVFIQCQLIGCRIFPCYPDSGSCAHVANDGGDNQRATRAVFDTADLHRGDSSFSRTALLTGSRWDCPCDHCAEHLQISETAAAERAAARAAAAFEAATASLTSASQAPWSRRSLSRAAGRSSKTFEYRRSVPQQHVHIVDVDS